MNVCYQPENLRWPHWRFRRQANSHRVRVETTHSNDAVSMRAIWQVHAQLTLSDGSSSWVFTAPPPKAPQAFGLAYAKANFWRAMKTSVSNQALLYIPERLRFHRLRCLPQARFLITPRTATQTGIPADDWQPPQCRLRSPSRETCRGC